MYIYILLLGVGQREDLACGEIPEGRRYRVGFVCIRNIHVCACVRACVRVYAYIYV